MAWRKPTENDLIASLSQMEVDAFRRSADFGHDPVEILLARTAAWARGYIRSNGSVRMSPVEGSLPESCISPAMDYAVIDVLKRINVEPKEVRVQARREAIDFFTKIAAGKVVPESYESPEDKTTSGPAVEIVTSSRSRMDAERLEGL